YFVLVWQFIRISPVGLAITIIWVLIGLLIYYAYSVPHKVEEIEKHTLFEEKMKFDEKAHYRILLPLMPEPGWKGMLRIALSMAKSKNGEIHVLRITEIPPASLTVTSESAKWWKERRASLAIPQDDRYAVLHPTALYATKQWAPEKFAALGGYLERERGLRVVYSCGPGEEVALTSVQQAAGAVIRRLEGPKLGNFLAALAGARIFIGNDSGPAHMAAAVGRPGVVIFGSSSSPLWGPWRPRAPWRIVQNPYDCNPCPGDRCYRYDRPECILSVTFEQVRSAAEEILAQTEPASK
ncbi:MAG: glycosyltransferase family 9 protein, partial [Acidobacteriia bacterium]|nr:glycosyltransferase family 9 protein [Terriglobia bacterium]